MQRWNAQLSARGADAVRGLRRQHWAGMLSNAVVLVAVVASIPFVSAASS